MQNETLFPALRRVYPATIATPFVQPARAAAADTVGGVPAGQLNSSLTAVARASRREADSTPTIFLASALARLGPVLGVILLLWGLIAWSAGWLGALVG
ncbi:hypothetical protein CAP48_04655 [Advenella sp. S44]|uniref:hypothetical protein n=1 Tax=Advenella sp. S44 TaxID=1982755 RepID=UPI000C2AB9CD|nr:hypothetical protein [Advenella sp. S44]PJX25351.1 hypothetical protein CAP48_04655 [Advenella sp. S44]